MDVRQLLVDAEVLAVNQCHLADDLNQVRFADLAEFCNGRQAGFAIQDGLTLMNRYISGDNVHTGTITDGKEWGRESELGYTVQSGALKDLNVKWRNSTMRRDYSNNEFDENRVIISYPISLL